MLSFTVGFCAGILSMYAITIIVDIIYNGKKKTTEIAIPLDGMMAAQKGLQLEDNPYRKNTAEHSIWRDDWMDFHGWRQ